MSLVLGGIIFTDYAIPEKVKQGGTHKFVTHRLMGGGRVVDAMGPDDADIPWTGRFQGAGAVDKAKEIDQLRKSGAQVPLVVNGQFYIVGVHSFEWDEETTYQVVYRISCLVVSSGGFGSGSLFGSLDSLVAGDMAQVANIVSQIAGG